MLTLDIGKLVRDARKSLGLTQKTLAMTCGTGTRFIIELEQGKDTCQIGKVLKVLHMLGIESSFKVAYRPYPQKEKASSVNIGISQ